MVELATLLLARRRLPAPEHERRHVAQHRERAAQERGRRHQAAVSAAHDGAQHVRHDQPHERDAARRNQTYLRVQEVIYEEMPEVPLYTSYNRFITSKNYTPVFSPVRPGYMENLFKQQN